MNIHAVLVHDTEGLADDWPTISPPHDTEQNLVTEAFDVFIVGAAISIMCDMVFLVRCCVFKCQIFNFQ